MPKKTTNTTTRIQFAVFIPEETPISELRMGKRATNGLSRNGILTVGGIMDNWLDLGELRSIGVDTVKEIRAAVFAYNLALIWDDDEKMHRFAESIDWWKERAAS